MVRHEMLVYSLIISFTGYEQNKYSALSRSSLGLPDPLSANSKSALHGSGRPRHNQMWYLSKYPDVNGVIHISVLILNLRFALIYLQVSQHPLFTYYMH